MQGWALEARFTNALLKGERRMPQGPTDPKGGEAAPVSPLFKGGTDDAELLLHDFRSPHV